MEQGELLLTVLCYCMIALVYKAILGPKRNLE